MADSVVNWHKGKVLVAVQNASDELLTKIAFRGESYARLNITNNDQIDTGFMRAATYGKGPNGGGQGRMAGLKAARIRIGKRVGKSGTVRMRYSAPEVELEPHTAAVHSAAEYAIHQEVKKPFLYPIIEQLRREFPQIVGEVKKL